MNITIGNTQPALKKAVTVKSATIARLHNIGNYEHCRYEITVDIPEGVHAGAVMQKISQLLTDLDPKPPVDEWSLNQARRELAFPEEGLEEYQRGNRPAHEATLAKYNEWASKQAAAFEALGSLTLEVKNSTDHSLE